MLVLFLDSFFATFLLTFQGELALTAMVVFYDELVTPYIVAVIAGCCGLTANYIIGRLLSAKFVPLLSSKAHDKYLKTKKIFDNILIYTIPLTSLSFIGNVLFLDSMVGNFINIMANTLILIFGSVITLFSGLFRVNFAVFLAIILISRFIAYYFYLF